MLENNILIKDEKLTLAGGVLVSPSSTSSLTVSLGAIFLDCLMTDIDPMFQRVNVDQVESKMQNFVERLSKYYRMVWQWLSPVI